MSSNRNLIDEVERKKRRCLYLGLVAIATFCLIALPWQCGCQAIGTTTNTPQSYDFEGMAKNVKELGVAVTNTGKSVTNSTWLILGIVTLLLLQDTVWFYIDRKGKK